MGIRLFFLEKIFLYSLKFFELRLILKLFNFIFLNFCLSFDNKFLMERLIDVCSAVASTFLFLKRSFIIKSLIFILGVGKKL